MVIAWTLATNPSDNYLECNGQSIDSTKYPKLYELMHNVPDYRGMFLRGLGGNSADLGELQNYALIEHTHEITMPASHGKSGNGGIPRFSDGDVWSNNKTKLTTGIYWKLPNGLIYQWGDYENRGFGHWQRIDFPIEFPNKIISISAISKRNGVGAAGVNYREDFTNSYCYFMPNGEGQSDYSTHFYWSVIGY